MVYGAAGAFIEPYVPKLLGKWTMPAAYAAAGYFFKKNALFTLAGYSAAKAFTNGGGLGNGGYFQS